MEKKRVFLYLQAALCILTVIILGASVIGIYREGALWKAAGHPGDWIFTPEKAREVILRVLPVLLCGCVLTVTGLLQGVMDGNEELPPADTETSRDLICGRVKEPAEAMIHERELQKKLRIGGWAGALGCMVPVLLYITDGRNFESTDLEAVMGALAAGQGQVLGRYGGRMRTGARLAVVAELGGTVAELGGGKFANGAMTAAFAFLFSDNSHDKNNDNELAAEERLQLEIGEYAKSFVGDLAPNGDSYCNHFVKYILTHFGVYPNGNDLLAKDWANRDIPNWKIVTDGSFRNGDVAAFAWQMTDATGHCGIVYNVMINNQLIPHLIYVTYNSANVKMNKLSVFRLGSNNKKPNWIIRRYSK